MSGWGSDAAGGPSGARGRPAPGLHPAGDSGIIYARMQSFPPSDFRAPAVADTQAFLRSEEPLDRIARSGCLPVQPIRPGAMRVQGIVELALLLGAFGVVLATSLLMAFKQGLPLAWNVAAFTLWAGGITYVFWQNALFGRLLRGRIAGWRDRLFDPFATQTVVVNLENAATHQKIKLVGEDKGVCFFDAARRRVLIEGLVCRYAIAAADVVRLEPLAKHREGGGVLIEFRVGGATLGLTLMDVGGGRRSTRRSCRCPRAR